MSSGHEACISSILRLRKDSPQVFKLAADQSFILCFKPDSKASAISATHHARVNKTKLRSTAITCENFGSVTAKYDIISSNLFISQPMLLPSARRGGVSLKNFVFPQPHIG